MEKKPGRGRPKKGEVRPVNIEKKLRREISKKEKEKQLKKELVGSEEEEQQEELTKVNNKVYKSVKKNQRIDTEWIDINLFKKNRKIKWTREKVVELLNQMINGLESNPHIRTLMAIQNKYGISSYQFAYLRYKYSEDDEICSYYSYIYDIIENRIWALTANNNINMYVGLFTLKAYHCRVERQHELKAAADIKEIETNSLKGDISINFNYKKDPNTSNEKNE